MQIPSPLDPCTKDVTLELSGADPVYNNSACTSLSVMERRGRQHTTRAQAVSESTEQRNGKKEELINARPGNPTQPAIRYASPPPPAGQALQRIPSPQRNHSGRNITSYTDSGMPPQPANLPARYANLRTGNSARRSGSTRMTPPASPYANPSDPRSPHAGVRGGPMSSGNLSGPLSGRGMFPAYDALLNAHLQSGENPSKSLEMIPGAHSICLRALFFL